MMEQDVILIGGGPASLTCALYLARAKKSCVILEKYVPGGKLIDIPHLDNYPGVEKGSGPAIASALFSQVMALGVEVLQEEVRDIKQDETGFLVTTQKESFHAKAVVIGTGTFSKKKTEKPLQNLDKFKGKGISVCATCDGYFYKNEKVAIKIDEEKEVEDVLYLSSLASDVYLFTDLENLSLPSNVHLIKGEIKKVDGNQVMSSLTYEENNEEHVLPVKALFLPSFGGGSDSFLSSLPLERKPDGSIITDEQMKTNFPGVFAIGDCRNTMLKQVVTACSDGAIASLSIIRYLREVK